MRIWRLLHVSMVNIGRRTLVNPRRRLAAHRLSELRLELRTGEYYERGWEDLAELESAAVLIATLAGEAAIEFQGPPGQSWQDGSRVNAFAYMLES